MYKSASNLFLSLLKQMSTPKSKFVIAVLSKRLDDAKSLGLEMYKKHPNYLLFYYFLTQNENKQLLLKILKNCVNFNKNDSSQNTKSECNFFDLHLIVHLLKSDKFEYQDIRFLEELYLDNSFIGLCIKKLFFLKKFKNLSLTEVKRDKVNELIPKDNKENTSIVNQDMCGIIDKELPIEAIGAELNNLIEKIDDFDLYQFALDKGIAVLEKDTVNFVWYKFMSTKAQEYGVKLLSSTKNFTEISKIISICPDLKSNNKSHDVLLEYLKFGYSHEYLSQAYTNYAQDPSFMNLKTLLALLIASTDEKYLLLALHLTNQKNFEDNYEIKLISLFLSRHFLVLSNIKRIFSELDIKNIQQHNLAFIWSDVMITKKIAMQDMVNTFKKEVSAEIAATEGNLTELIDEGRIAIPFSLLNLRDKLKSSVIVKEIDSLQIHSESSSNMFTDLLGPGCSYMFSKLTVNDKISKKGTIETLLSVPINSFSREVFKNSICDIVDEKFISYFETKAKYTLNK